MPTGGGRDGTSPCSFYLDRDEGLEGCEGKGPPSMTLGSLWPEA
jgi:hypothetical protein